MVPGSGNSGFLFLSLYCSNIFIHALYSPPHTHTHKPGFLTLHAFKVLRNNYQAKSGLLRGYMAVNFLIGAFHSTNIDKGAEAESIQLCFFYLHLASPLLVVGTARS